MAYLRNPNRSSAPAFHRMTSRLALACVLMGASGALAAAQQAEQPAREGFIEFNGGRLHHEEAGKGCPVVLIAGGGGMDSRQWDEQFAFLQRKYRAIRFEPRSSGKSDNAGAPYSNVDDLKAVLDSLKVEKTALAGVSSGGAIALEFALTYPDRVVGLVLAAPLVQGFQMSDAQRQRVAGFAIAGEAGIEAAIQVFLADPHFIPAPHNSCARKRAEVLMRENSRPVTPGLQRLLDPPVVVRVSQIALPTLLLVGELDHPDLHRRMEFLQSAIRGSSKEILPNAGHMSNLQNPRDFNRAMERFLQSLPCPSQPR